MPIFVDDSVQDRGGFVLAAVIHGPDPTPRVDEILSRAGLTPGVDEFKSSAWMHDRPALRTARQRLLGVLQRNYRTGVVVAPRVSREDFGPDILRGLRKMIMANDLGGILPTAYLDGGIFRNERAAHEAIHAEEIGGLCRMRVEQDSAVVRGLQLADLAAHTCGLILLHEMGLLGKTVRVDSSSGYGPGTELPLGFELWAGLRWTFFREGEPIGSDGPDLMTVNVEPRGLYLAESCPDDLRQHAQRRFGTQYLGCIH